MQDIQPVLQGKAAGAVMAAGFFGGLAEVMWVSLYAAFTPLRGWDVAREVTASVFPGMASASFAPALGLVIHFILSFAIAAAFAAILWRPVSDRFGSRGVMVAAMMALVAIWAMNFFVVLPVLNVRFTELMPLGVSFTSKALFGLSLGAVFGRVRLKQRGEFGVRLPRGRDAAV